MEFNFRSKTMDQRSTSSSTYFPPPPHPPPPTFSYFTQQAIRAGFAPNGVVSRDAMQRELEKERIRAEIIAEEIVRRRVLEQEVRRELMLERERDLGRFRFGPPGPMMFEPPRLPPLLTHFDNPETMPFQRDPVVAGTGLGVNGNVNGVTLKEIKGNAAVPEVPKKDKVIILAKPNANSADLKRKATTPPGAADVELKPVGSKKPKTKDDWSCALCRITATSERGLNEHLQGKRHQARERGMVSQRMGFGVGPLPKNTVANTSKPITITNTPSSRKMDGKVDEKPTKKTSVEDTLSQKKENSVEKKENGEADVPKTKPGSTKSKKKFRFWCEACQVGAYSQKVMNAHKKGKKHLAKLDQTGEPTPEQKTAQNFAAVEKKAPEVAAGDLKQETAAEPEPVEIKEVNIDGDLSGTEDKNKVIASAGGDVTIEQENNEVLAINEKDDVTASAGGDVAIEKENNQALASNEKDEEVIASAGGDVTIDQDDTQALASNETDC